MNVVHVGAGMQVHVPLYDPSSVLQLVVCSAQPKVHKARVVTRAVRSMLTQVSPPLSAPTPFLSSSAAAKVMSRELVHSCVCLGTQH